MKNEYEHQNTGSAVRDDACGDAIYVNTELVSTRRAIPYSREGQPTLADKLRVSADLVQARAVVDAVDDGSDSRVTSAEEMAHLDSRESLECHDILRTLKCAVS